MRIGKLSVAALANCLAAWSGRPDGSAGMDRAPRTIWLYGKG